VGDEAGQLEISALSILLYLLVKSTAFVVSAIPQHYVAVPKTRYYIFAYHKYRGDLALDDV